MSYLKDYLKVIPKADSQRVRENIAENHELFEIEHFTEADFAELVNRLVDDKEIQTRLRPLSPLIKADELNRFYRDVAMDLARLFPEQNQLELAGENYMRIYQGHLDELKQGIHALTRTVEQLEQTSRGEKGLVLKSYGFEPDKRLAHMETKTPETAYLFTDRNGEDRAPAETNRLFHTYYLSLSRQSEANVVMDSSGHITAKLDVVYESPYALKQTGTAYHPDHALDGDASTFWQTIALKPNNALDGVSIGPREER